MKHRSLLLLAVVGLCVPLFTTSASEDEHRPMMEEEGHGGMQSSETKLESMDDLIEEVRVLRKEVESLKARQPTITSLMPDFSERFHVMHYAGDAGDWAVAGHELLELQRIVELAKKISPENGALMEGFLAQKFETINSAIEHGNSDAFNKLLVETVDQCNACHTAVGSSFIKISLDARESLSMRHSHELQASEKMGDHTHEH